MNVDEVKPVEGFYRVSGLCFVIGIQESGSARDIDHLHTGEAGDAAQEVDCGDHTAGKTILLPERCKRRFLPAAPWPDPGGGEVPLFQAAPVDRVVGKDLFCTLHTVEEDSGIPAAREELPDRLADDIMGRCGLGPECPGNDHQVPIADPGVEPDIIERGIQVTEEFSALGA